MKRVFLKSTDYNMIGFVFDDGMIAFADSVDDETYIK